MKIKYALSFILLISGCYCQVTCDANFVIQNGTKTYFTIFSENKTCWCDNYQGSGKYLKELELNSVIISLMERITKLENKLKIDIFPGQVTMKATEEVPEGWLLCNGTEILIEDYKELYNVIGNLYGIPSHPKKFKLPDFRGMFLKGLKENGKMGLKEEQSKYTNIPQAAGYTMGGIYGYLDGQTIKNNGYPQGVDYLVTVGHSHTLPDDLHPTNMPILYIIKY